MSFDHFAESAARRAGNRITRRSFIGRLALAISAAGAGSLAFRSAPALAIDCPCRVCGDSTACGGSFGHPCPSFTCAGGAWYMCTTYCGTSHLTKFQDCMLKHSCHTYCGKDHRPGCYYRTPYGSCGGRSTVWCRSVTCVKSNQC
jgi:hypothetical protein